MQQAAKQLNQMAEGQEQEEPYFQNKMDQKF